jgi:hypothetical protein
MHGISNLKVKYDDLSMTSGFCRDADENCARLGYTTASSGNPGKRLALSTLLYPRRAQFLMNCVCVFLSEDSMFRCSSVLTFTCYGIQNDYFFAV